MALEKDPQQHIPEESMHGEPAPSIPPTKKSSSGPGYMTPDSMKIAAIITGGNSAEKVKKNEEQLNRALEQRLATTSEAEKEGIENQFQQSQKEHTEALAKIRQELQAVSAPAPVIAPKPPEAAVAASPVVPQDLVVSKKGFFSRLKAWLPSFGRKSEKKFPITPPVQVNITPTIPPVMPEKSVIKEEVQPEKVTVEKPASPQIISSSEYTIMPEAPSISATPVMTTAPAGATVAAVTENTGVILQNPVPEKVTPPPPKPEPTITIGSFVERNQQATSPIQQESIKSPEVPKEPPREKAPEKVVKKVEKRVEKKEAVSKRLTTVQELERYFANNNRQASKLTGVEQMLESTKAAHWIQDLKKQGAPEKIIKSFEKKLDEDVEHATAQYVIDIVNNTRGVSNRAREADLEGVMSKKRIGQYKGVEARQYVLNVLGALSAQSQRKNIDRQFLENFLAKNKRKVA